MVNMITRNFIYVQYHTKGIIICNQCKSEFDQTPANHITGYGCPHCCSSRSEIVAREILENLTEKKFPKKRPSFMNGLEFDGFCEELKLAFEYQGRQHYEFNEHFHRGDEKQFIAQQERDKEKVELSEKNGIKLILIPYTYSYLNTDKMSDYIELELMRLDCELKYITI